MSVNWIKGQVATNHKCQIFTLDEMTFGSVNITKRAMLNYCRLAIKQSRTYQMILPQLNKAREIENVYGMKIFDHIEEACAFNDPLLIFGETWKEKFGQHLSHVNRSFKNRELNRHDIATLALNLKTIISEYDDFFGFSLSSSRTEAMMSDWLSQFDLAEQVFFNIDRIPNEKEIFEAYLINKTVSVVEADKRIYLGFNKNKDGKYHVMCDVYKKLMGSAPEEMECPRAS